MNEFSTLKRVGIVTLFGSFNYGNRLQSYAVQRVFSSLGWSACELVLSQRWNVVREVKKLGKKVLGKESAPSPESLMSPARRDAFTRFSSNMQTELLVKLENSLVSRFDKFSVGSDQVWNPNYIAYDDDWYFLKFARPDQRVALAPSMGIDVLSSSQARLIRRGVKGFHRLSVREQRGAELIEECSGRKAEVLCDPTLTLSADEWCSVADARSTPSHPYVFTYLLGGIGPEAEDALCRATRYQDIPVVPLSDRQKQGEPDAGPAEFISLIDNAEHVVTDSFHAAVFAAMLHTPLTIVHRGGNASMFSRLEQLSRMLGIGHKIYRSPEFDFSRAGDYENVSEAIEREREKFMYYLEGCLNG